MTFDAEKETAAEAVGVETDVQPSALLFEVSVDADAGGRLSDGVIVAVLFGTPGEVQSGAVRFVSPGQSGVDDVFTIATDGHETTVRGVEKALRVDFTRAKLFERKDQRRTVLSGHICVAAGQPTIPSYLGRPDSLPPPPPPLT